MKTEHYFLIGIAIIIIYYFFFHKKATDLTPITEQVSNKSI
jgi:hypothetical protein